LAGERCGASPRVSVSQFIGENGCQRFQSFLCWLGLVGQWPAGAERGSTPVSILVVLDRVGRPESEVRHPPRQIGFNPCCVGSGWSAPTSAPWRPRSCGGFNPCCVGSGWSAPA